MSNPKRRSVACLRPEGFRRMAYREWGGDHAGDAPVVICVHGLTRNAADFDPLAAALCGHARVLCPDVLGRGDSDWLTVPSGYSYDGYVADMAALIARSDAVAVDWVGTSMGGLIGLFLAASPGTPVRRLVMNDVGPVIGADFIRFLKTYVGTDPRFATLEEAERFFRFAHAGFGALSDPQWVTLTQESVRPAQGGGFRLAYDPALAVPLQALPEQDIDLWAVWQAVTVPTLVLRGAESPLLDRATLAKMAERPGVTVAEISGCGHAPALMDPAQIALVRDWLTAA